MSPVEVFKRLMSIVTNYPFQGPIYVIHAPTASGERTICASRENVSSRAVWNSFISMYAAGFSIELPQTQVAQLPTCTECTTTANEIQYSRRANALCPAAVRESPSDKHLSSFISSSWISNYLYMLNLKKRKNTVHMSPANDKNHIEWEVHKTTVRNGYAPSVSWCHISDSEQCFNNSCLRIYPLKVSSIVFIYTPFLQFVLSVMQLKRIFIRNPDIDGWTDAKNKNSQ